ncbi:hypothetical protein VPHD195_0084 [Vibrio phage D195]
MKIGDTVNLVAIKTAKLNRGFNCVRGESYRGKVVSLSDPMVGCPVVELVCGAIVDIGYNFKIQGG